MAEGAWRLVQEAAQLLQPGSIQHRGGALGPRGTGGQGRKAAGVEGADGVAHGLHRAAQALRNGPRRAPCRAQPHDLSTPHAEGAWGTQADVELGALRAAQLTNEDRWVHPDQMRPAMPSHKSYRGIALEPL